MKSFDELKALIEQRGTHAVFGAPGEGWAIEQNPEELAEFLVAMQELGVQSVLEIGTGYKAGLARFLHDDMGYTVTSVDSRDYGHSFDGITFEKTDGVEYPHFLEQFDLVFIDGGHSYDDVLFDHDYYRKYAAKVIAFHDIAGLRECEGVEDYWWEIAHGIDYDPEGNKIADVELRPGYHEIIANTPERGGIGYIVLDEAQREPEPPKPEAPVKKPATSRKRTPAKKPTRTAKR